MKRKLSPGHELAFITAGDALFTVRNSNTGNRFTYNVAIPNDQKPESASIWFVSVLTGCENTSDYSYIGWIRKDNATGKFFFKYGVKSRVGENAPSVVAFDFIFNKLLVPGFGKPNLEIWHEGKCCRCGRTLTVPESIESGVGPECARIMSRSFT